MNPKIKARWLKALRSGKYTQGRFHLRNPDNTFCCLGVLCDLHAKSSKKKWKWRKIPDAPWEYLGESGVLPDDVLAWAGLEPYPRTVRVWKTGEPRVPTDLASMNDGGAGFETIANIIDKEL